MKVGFDRSLSPWVIGSLFWWLLMGGVSGQFPRNLNWSLFCACHWDYKLLSGKPHVQRRPINLYGKRRINPLVFLSKIGLLSWREQLRTVPSCKIHFPGLCFKSVFCAVVAESSTQNINLLSLTGIFSYSDILTVFIIFVASSQSPWHSRRSSRGEVIFLFLFKRHSFRTILSRVT